jgi:hypothetical protein
MKVKRWKASDARLKAMAKVVFLGNITPAEFLRRTRGLTIDEGSRLETYIKADLAERFGT